MILKTKIKISIKKIIIRIIQYYRQLFYIILSDNKIIGKVKKLQPVQCMGYGKIIIDKNVTIGFPKSPYFFSTYAYIEARNINSCIYIGSGTWINNNFSVIAEHHTISIGKKCFIGYNVEIFDSDFHGQRIQERNNSLPALAKSVNIGDEVFIGSNSKILKGVSIGNGAIIGAGSVVINNVEEMVIVAGNPAKYIKKVDK